MRVQRRFGVLLAALVTMLAPTLASAAPMEFATFKDLSGTPHFNFNNNGGTSGGMSENAQVIFDFTAQSGLSTADHAATLTISGTTFTPASTFASFIDQPISNPGTLKLTDNATGKNLLTMTFTGDIFGRGPNASLSGDDATGDTVIFSSDFLTFTPPGNSYNISLGAIAPPLSIGPGGFVNSFAADAGPGAFVANFSLPVVTPPTPAPVSTPEPSSLALLGLGGVALAGWHRWKKRKPTA